MTNDEGCAPVYAAGNFLGSLYVQAVNSARAVTAVENGGANGGQGRIGAWESAAPFGQAARYFQRGTSSSFLTQPVWPFSKVSCCQPRKDLVTRATLPAGRAVVFCVVSASVGIERSVPARHATTAEASAVVA